MDKTVLFPQITILLPAALWLVWENIIPGKEIGGESLTILHNKSKIMSTNIS